MNKKVNFACVFILRLYSDRRLVSNIYIYLAVCQDGQIRLAGGSTQYEGRVEICQFEQWGTICDSPWDDAAAIVICRQLRNSPDSEYNSIFTKLQVHCEC